MKSKLVEKRHKQACKLTSMTIKYADDVARVLNRAYTVHCGSEAPEPDWASIQTFAGFRVDRLRTDLLSADSRQLAAERRARQLRHRRDDSSRRLHRKLCAIRRLFDSAYGDGSCEHILGLRIGMSRKPAAVFRFAERAVRRLKDPELALPPPAVALVRLDLERLVGDIEGDLLTLGRSLEQLRENRRSVRRATSGKRSAMHRFDREIKPWTRLLQALYELAGEPALADDLKAPRRAKRRGC